MRRLLALLLLIVALPCAAGEYHPTIYPLRPGLVAPLHLGGTVSIVNGQPSATPDIVYKYGFMKLTSPMHEVTQVMADQTASMLGLQGPPATAPDKTVELKVNTLLSKYVFFSWSSKIQFEARLGDGTVITKEVKHASGNPLQDLNGCIAEGVMHLLNDPQVRTYLEAPVAAAVAPPVAEAPAPASDAEAATAPAAEKN